MLHPSKKALLAIEDVVDIAYYSGTSPVRSSEISERQGIPRRYLEQVLQQLVHHGVLAGQRGPRGGYRLARERRRITLGEIVRVVGEVEGRENPANNEQGSEIGLKVVRPIWRELQSGIMAQLDQVTVDQLCERARLEASPSASADIPDFTI